MGLFNFRNFEDLEYSEYIQLTGVKAVYMRENYVVYTDGDPLLKTLILQEYFRGNWCKIEVVIGNSNDIVFIYNNTVKIWEVMITVQDASYLK